MTHLVYFKFYQDNDFPIVQTVYLVPFENLNLNTVITIFFKPLLIQQL